MMHRRAILAMLLLLGGSRALAATAPSTISGVVVSAASGAALAGSTVTLSQGDGSPVRTTMADSHGRYVFENLPPGTYQVKASRAYFAPGRYGQRVWNGAGRIIALAPGTGFTAEIALRRLGVITGLVLDENGEGMSGIAVRAINATPSGIMGHGFAEAVTDDRGSFRIAGLQPGRYYVATAPRQLPDGTGLLPTYFPSQLNLSESQPVKVEIDRETGGVEIRPVAGSLVRLSGFLAVPGHGAGGQAKVTLFRGEQSWEATAGALGEFVFNGLVPGHYTLVAQVTSPDGARDRAAYLPMDLSDDRDGLTVNLAPAPEIRVLLTDEKGAAVNNPQVVMFLSRIENGARTQPVRVEPEHPVNLAAHPVVNGPGRSAGASAEVPSTVYVASGLMPGQWRFFVLCPTSVAVGRVTVDGKDALAGFPLMPGHKASAVIRLTSEVGKVHGRVTGADGSPAPRVSVLCYPLSQENLDRLGGFRSQKTNLLGEYSFAGLPVGDYLVFATDIEDFEPDEQIEDLKTRLPALQVGASADLTEDLRLME